MNPYETPPEAESQPTAEDLGDRAGCLAIPAAMCLFFSGCTIAWFGVTLIQTLWMPRFGILLWPNWIAALLATGLFQIASKRFTQRRVTEALLYTTAAIASLIAGATMAA